MHETPNSNPTNPLDSPWDALPKTFESKEPLPAPEISYLNPETDDLKKAASLIYQVDPYICPDFFGDPETAEKMAPVLFSQPGSLFNPSRILVAKQDDNLLGILIYADNTVAPWNCEKVKSEFLAEGISLSEHFDRANQNYMAAVSDEARTLKDGVMEIEFLAVDSAARGQGVGSKLFQAALDLPYSEQHLTVLADNPSALHLYQKHGFEIVSTQTGYPDDSVTTHNMVRHSNAPSNS